jgi:predicted Zn finger-like uncharacterized protein
MELTCPNCAARYRVALEALSPQGRDIHCAKCGQGWFQPWADTGEPFGHDTPLAEGVPDFGAVEVPAMPLGPAGEAPRATGSSDPRIENDAAWEDPRPARRGLGSLGWILLVLVLALAAAGVYAYRTGLIGLPA